MRVPASEDGAAVRTARRAASQADNSARNLRHSQRAPDRCFLSSATPEAFGSGRLRGAYRRLGQVRVGRSGGATPRSSQTAMAGSCRAAAVPAPAPMVRGLAAGLRKRNPRLR